MANPVFVSCIKDSWTKVATNVTTGAIHKFDVTPYEYLQTYRDTGDPAPTLITEGIPAFENSRTDMISATSGIDIYLYPITATGKVRVDL
ncbi:MAG: hypothetical protein DRH26_05330 [Deltaproteobacteria bacterium]|nr:MAG: hypothetical protein DRH26_05330 [Deltaproteobacteria bacterium]